MDVYSDRSQEAHLKFGQVLKEYRAKVLNGDESIDPFGIVQEFRAIAGEEALQVAGSGNYDTTEQFQNWELEAKFWDLVELLIEYRTSDTVDEDINVHSYNSNVVFQKQLLQSNKGIYEIWLIKSWLEANLGLPERPDSLSTTKWTNSMIAGTVKSMDPDSIIRDSTTSLEPEDRKNDREFFVYAFRLLLAGQFERLTQECEYTDNLTLNLILRGIDSYVDPNVDTEMNDEYSSQQGIKRHALWRRSVYALSQDPSLDPYEAAIYTYLAGDSPENLTIDDLDWETELLVYINHIWNVTIENHLIEHGRVDKDELISSMDTTCPSLSQVLNILASKYPEESEHPIRVLIASVFLNTIGPVVKSSTAMLLDVIKGEDKDNGLFNESYLLRILTNLTIFLDIVSPDSVDVSDKSKLLTYYVSLLSFYGLNEIVPVFISFLTEEEGIEAYSFFLTNLVDPDVRQKQIELSTYVGLPTANILRRTAQRVFEETDEHYIVDQGVELTNEISEVDQRLMNGVEWLIEFELYTDSINTIIALSRRFLINGKVKALEFFLSRHDIPNLLKEYQLEQISLQEDDESSNLKSNEIMQYTSLLSTFKKQNDWVNSSQTFSTESKLPSLIKQFKEFSNCIIDLVTTFLVELTDGGKVDDPEVLYEIRALYTPFLIMELHRNLISASETLKVATFVQEAIDLSILVANETDKLYLLFQSSGKLNAYLQMVAKASALFGK
ncbi:unnamed protein product [Kluyveromyces dobzhanskii CBS 2104]|uniref:Nuclear pore complex protein n=1 Tax=Kluyveromyces dobzhanskii CBS 2104 TaxID=1427455 RepID=A0A0A8L6S5_9SACH|nr:unnamed protein product [Kluyveromyces dobzhanskii CBS 2104]